MSARYPLWCVDTGEETEQQYRGPYDTEQEANGAAEEGDAVRRCRRVRASEIKKTAYLARLAKLIYSIDGDALDGELPDAAWADFEDAIVSERENGDALETLLRWADENLVVKAFVCEGDE